jgi:hypothetical protein
LAGGEKKGGAQMVEIRDLEKKSTEEILGDMNNGKMGRPTDVPFQVAKAAIEIKIVNQICGIISGTGESLFKTSTVLKEAIDKSLETLKISIDDFRKSNERTSKALVVLTAVIGFAALVQAFYAIVLILKGK